MNLYVIFYKMLGFFKIILNFLQLFTSFSLYTWNRSVCKMKHYWRPYSELRISEELSESSSTATNALFSNLLENKTFSYSSKILFPITAEWRWHNGVIRLNNTSTASRFAKLERCIRSVNTTSVEELIIFYVGSLKLMHLTLDLPTRVTLKNVKIFTDFTVHSYGCDTMLRNVCFDDVNLEMSIFDFKLYNRSSYFVLSSILKIVSFYILCFFEFVIGLQLKSKFSCTDFSKIIREPVVKSKFNASFFQKTLEYSFKSNLIKYINRTTNLNNSYLKTDIISSINDVLVEGIRNMLVQLLPEYENGNQEQKSEVVDGGKSSYKENKDSRFEVEDVDGSKSSYKENKYSRFEVEVVDGGKLSYKEDKDSHSKNTPHPSENKDSLFDNEVEVFDTSEEFDSYNYYYIPD